MTRHVLTILAVHDVAAAAAFYDRAFGWTRAVDVPVYVEYALPGGARVGLYQREAFARNVGGVVPAAAPPGGLTGAELYFHVDDLDAAIARLAGAGARCLSERAARPWGDEAAYFADLDGTVLVVARAVAG